MANTSQVELRYSCFRPFLGHSRIIIWLWPKYTNIYRLTRVKTRLILKNAANNSIFASVLDLILNLRSSNSTLIFQFCDSALTRLRLQSFDISLDDELRVGTQLCRYLLIYSLVVFRSWGLHQSVNYKLSTKLTKRSAIPSASENIFLTFCFYRSAKRVV